MNRLSGKKLTMLPDQYSTDKRTLISCLFYFFVFFFVNICSDNKKMYENVTT